MYGLLLAFVFVNGTTTMIDGRQTRVIKDSSCTYLSSSTFMYSHVGKRSIGFVLRSTSMQNSRGSKQREQNKRTDPRHLFRLCTRLLSSQSSHSSKTNKKFTMKLAIVATLIASASAFAPQANNARPSVAVEAESRRDALASIAAAGVAILPAVANAAAGESPRFSVFGVIGDGSSYSEGAAYGSDQSAPLYSPYSVYPPASENSLYQPGNSVEVTRNKGYIAESQKRLAKLPYYVSRKEWFNVKDELTRYMYETRGAVRNLAQTPEQKKIAGDFFKSIEEVTLQATLKNQDKCAAAVDASIKNLDTFSASL